MKFQVRLAVAREPLQIPVPGRAEELHLTTQPRYVDEVELAAAQAYLSNPNLPYQQSLLFTGAVLSDESEPLDSFDHDELDRLETALGLPNTRKSPAGGTRMIHERVCLIRESGYTNGGHEVRRALAAAA